MRTKTRRTRVEELRAMRVGRGLDRELAVLAGRVDPGLGGPSNAELDAVVREAWSVRGVPGAVLVLGFGEIETSMSLRRLLGYGADLHVYDSFDDPPEPTGEDLLDPLDPRYVAGYSLVPPRPEPGGVPRSVWPGSPDVLPRAEVRAYWAAFEAAGLKPPETHEGVFADQDYPRQIAFALVYVDLFWPMRDALRAVLPRVSPGGRVVASIYSRGTRRAVTGVDMTGWTGALRAGLSVFWRE